MLLPLLFFAAALVVKQDQTPLRTGCDASDTVVATLPAGTKLDVQYAIADGSNCFRVSGSLDGKSVQGFVPGDLLTGVDAFERERASAGDPGSIRMMVPELEKLGRSVADPNGSQAIQLIRGGQPAQALAILRQALTQHKNDPNLLA